MSNIKQLHKLGGCPKHARNLGLSKKQRKKLKKLLRSLEREHCKSLDRDGDDAWVLLGAINLVEGMLGSNA